MLAQVLMLLQVYEVASLVFFSETTYSIRSCKAFFGVKIVAYVIFSASWKASDWKSVSETPEKLRSRSIIWATNSSCQLSENVARNRPST